MSVYDLQKLRQSTLGVVPETDPKLPTLPASTETQEAPKIL